jgi:hypothetical protein
MIFEHGDHSQVCLVRSFNCYHTPQLKYDKLCQQSMSAQTLIVGVIRHILIAEECFGDRDVMPSFNHSAFDQHCPCNFKLESSLNRVPRRAGYGPSYAGVQLMEHAMPRI